MSNANFEMTKENCELCQSALQDLPATTGTMARAQVEMTKRFMMEKLCMSEEDVVRCGHIQVCSTNSDCLLVKFPSIAQAQIINTYKKNLPRESKVEDFIPPCLAPWEQVLISHGDKVRANYSTDTFKARTR